MAGNETPSVLAHAGQYRGGDRPVLVHLIEPAAWRAALAEGAVRPGDGRFVHFSTPEQVHLPAGRLFPGRQDLVLLVVDPARLTAPVR